MTIMVEFFIVSEDPNAIVTPVKNTDDHEDPTAFPSVDAAYASISRNEYGEYGRRYILKINAEVAAIAERGWSMIKPDPGPLPTNAEIRKALGVDHD